MGGGQVRPSWVGIAIARQPVASEAVAREAHSSAGEKQVLGEAQGHRERCPAGQASHRALVQILPKVGCSRAPEEAGDRGAGALWFAAAVRAAQQRQAGPYERCPQHQLPRTCWNAWYRPPLGTVHSFGSAWGRPQAWRAGTKPTAPILPPACALWEQQVVLPSAQNCKLERAQSKWGPQVSQAHSVRHQPCQSGAAEVTRPSGL